MIIPRSSCRLARQSFSQLQLCRGSNCIAPAGTILGRQTQRYMSAAAYQTPAGLKDLLRVSDEVADAVATNKPVVALESTIYTHGALGNDLGLEDVVRQGGGVPAVCGILNGQPVVGLNEEEVAFMVNSGTASKVSRRDVAHLVGLGMTGRKVHGGTTIAGTMLLARLAGIRIFGTGGLGGVHRGGENSMDVSADLTELGRTRVAVISAGCKGFLDIPRTLEFLETHGAFVATFADGRTGKVDFPAFWVRESGTKSPLVVETEREAAAMILAQERLNIESGMLFANPIPEEHAIPREEMDVVIETAVNEALEKGFTGARNTPYVLGRIRALTEERSTLANVALVRNNVARATKIAVELSKMLKEGTESVSSSKLFTGYDAAAKPATKVEAPKSSKADVLVAGSVAIDLSCDYHPLGDVKEVSPHMHTSNPACINQSIGGVGHNVALAAHRVSKDVSVRLCSMVGDDVAGKTVLSSLESSGLDTTYIRQLGSEYHHSNRTAQYVAVNDAEKNLVVAMADMGIFANHSFPDYWKSAVSGAKPGWLVVDGNWSPKDIRAWIQAGREQACGVAFEPVSTAKSIGLFPREHPHLGVFPNPGIDIASPNNFELTAMYTAAKENGFFDTPEWFEVIDAFNMRGARDRFVQLTSAEMTDAGIPVQTIHLLPYIPTLVTKLGSKGVLLTTILGRDDPRLKDRSEERWLLTRAPVDHPTVGGVYMRLFPPAEKVAIEDIVSVNGVGDTFLGVMIAGLAKGGKVQNLIDVAQKAAVLTLKSHESVSPDLGRLDEALKAAARS
ncbi:carbohydrate kinase contains PfkB domain [Colletotrichum asianum]